MSTKESGFKSMTPCVLPALTVTALTNCSLQLLLPTTKARFVFLINLSTVLYTHSHTSTAANMQIPDKIGKTQPWSCYPLLHRKEKIPFFSLHSSVLHIIYYNDAVKLAVKSRADSQGFCEKLREELRQSTAEELNLHC